MPHVVVEARTVQNATRRRPGKMPHRRRPGKMSHRRRPGKMPHRHRPDKMPHRRRRKLNNSMHYLQPPRTRKASTAITVVP